jgi:serine/threonine protein kinase
VHKVRPGFGSVRLAIIGLQDLAVLLDHLLDFGLTKNLNITSKFTTEGMVIGTVHYMSPEQARGKPVDKRADIWAFGCILYECLTGKRPFEGETVTETLASILKGEPDWKSLPYDTPLNLKVLLHRCCEKDPRERLHDIADRDDSHEAAIIEDGRCLTCLPVMRTMASSRVFSGLTWNRWEDMTSLTWVSRDVFPFRMIFLA